MIPRPDPIANPFRKVPNSSIFDILARPRDQTPPPNIQSSRARTDGSPENLRPDCTYRGKPPVSPFINGNRNTNYNNPSLLSNEVFYSSDYSVPFHGLIQHKPISPFHINQKTPPPERPNWKYENKTEPTNRSLSPTPSLPPSSRQEIDKWIKEGGGFSPITHLPKKPLPIIRRDKEYNQPNEPLKEEQMSTGKFGGRLQWNTPQRSKTPTPPQVVSNDKQPHTGRVCESVIQERSATPIGNSRRGNEIPKESVSERKGSKVKFSDPEEFSIKPVSINKEPTHDKRVNFHFAPQTPITQPNEEQWKKSLASRRPTRQTNSGNEDPKSPITPPLGLSKEGNSQSQPSMIKIKSVTEPSPPRNIKTPQEVKNLPISGYDDYCVNCVNTQMVETRKVKAIQDKSIDREKEKIISTNNIMKKQAEDQAIRDKKSKLVERTRIVQKTLEDEYEKKLEARRNKGEEIPRNLFEGIFERQDQISQRQREIMRKGIRGLQEQADPNRKKSPKEKFWEILDQKQARQFGDAYYNKHLPSPNEVLNSWREQLSYKEEKRRKEKTDEQLLAHEAQRREEMKMEQERMQTMKRVYHLREQTRTELNRNLAKKEAQKEEEKMRKLTEKEQLEKLTQEQRKRKIEEETQRKKKILEEQRHSMREAAQEAVRKKEKEKEWLLNQKRLGYDGSVLNNMGKEKQKDIKCCKNCNRTYQAACRSKGHDFS